MHGPWISWPCSCSNLDLNQRQRQHCCLHLTEQKDWGDILWEWICKQWQPEKPGQNNPIPLDQAVSLPHISSQLFILFVQIIWVVDRLWGEGCSNLKANLLLCRKYTRLLQGRVKTLLNLVLARRLCVVSVCSQYSLETRPSLQQGSDKT